MHIKSCHSDIDKSHLTIYQVLQHFKAVVLQRQAKGVGVRAQGNPRAHGNYKAGRACEEISASGKKY